MAKDDDILREAMERFEESDAHTSENRKQAREDMEFCLLDEQWPAHIRAQRRAEGRPDPWTINRLRPMVRQVVNDNRQNRPAINVVPVDSGADQDTAHVLREVVRSIQREAEAEVASDTAMECAVVGGFGFMRLTTDYAHRNSFDMVPRIERVSDPLGVYWDVSSSELDGRDWRYCFISETISETELKRRYPDARIDDWQGMSSHSMSEMAAQWGAGEYTRIAEYFTKEDQPFELVEISGSNGQRWVLPEDDIAARARQTLQALGLDPALGSDEEAIRFVMAAMGLEETRRRASYKPKVLRRVINGSEILEIDEWPGCEIPVIPVWGEEANIDGKRWVRGMVRSARDSQHMVNFWKNNAAERAALAPRAQWMGDVRAIKKYQDIWRTANTRNHAFLPYEGGIGDAPQRLPPPSIPTGDLQLAMNAADDLQSITGFYPAALGARSNETSGRAILARQQETDTGSFHFADNLNRGHKAVGRQLIDIIPALYSERAVIRVMGEDQTEKVFHLAQNGQSGMTADGRRLYDLGIGVYDVHITTGPSYASQRQSDREMLIEMARVYPDMVPLAFDVIVDALDLGVKDDLIERWRRATGQGQPQAMPPGVQPPGQRGPAPAAAPPQLQQQPGALMR
jgi:hypothetical protein